MRQLFLFLGFIASAGIAHGQINISSVQQNVQATNVLQYDVTFNTDVDAKTWVSYYYLDGADTVWKHTGINETPSTIHAFTLLGLVSSTQYTFRANAFDETGCVSSSDETFTTAALPGDLPSLDSMWSGNDVTLPGYILTNSHNSAARAHQMYDRKGNIVWYDYPPVSGAGVSNNRCKFFSYHTDRGSIITTDCHRIVEKRLDGTVLRDVDLTHRLDLFLHHDVFYNAAGNLVAIISQERVVDLSAAGGSDTAHVMGQGFIEIDSNDSIIMEWHNFEHYDVLTAPGPGGYWVPIKGPNSINWMHANAMSLDRDDNYLISFKNAHQIAKVNRTTGQIMWKLGGFGSDIDVSPADNFMDQHNIHPQGANNYMLFDNTGGDSVSRAMEFWIDFGYSIPMLMNVWDYTLPQEFSTDILGSAFRLPYGNTMLASGRSRGIFEVDEDGNQAWMARQSNWVYRAYPIMSFYDEVTAPTVMAPSVLCETDTAFDLMVDVEGGQFVGPGVTDGVFDPAAAGEGMHAVVYKYGFLTDTVMIEVRDSTNCPVGIGENIIEQSFVMFPNPMEENLTITFDLPVACEVKIDLTDLSGKKVSTLLDQQLSDGAQTLKLNNLEVAKGLYLLNVQCSGSQNISFTKRLVKH